MGYPRRMQPPTDDLGRKVPEPFRAAMPTYGWLGFALDERRGQSTLAIVSTVVESTPPET
jgi:hypothetical protein